MTKMTTAVEARGGREKERYIIAIVAAAAVFLISSQEVVRFFFSNFDYIPWMSGKFDEVSQSTMWLRWFIGSDDALVENNLAQLC